MENKNAKNPYFRYTYQVGSVENARNELVEGNLRLVLSVVQRFSNRGEKMDEYGTILLNIKGTAPHAVAELLDANGNVLRQNR